jgi:hypothetical protein
VEDDKWEILHDQCGEHIVCLPPVQERGGPRSFGRWILGHNVGEAHRFLEQFAVVDGAESRRNGKWTRFSSDSPEGDRFSFQDRLPFVENFRARRFQFRKIDDEQCAKLSSSASAVDGSFSGDSSMANSTQQFGGHHFGSEDAVEQQALWNCDGEKVDCADCVVRSHLQLVRVFRRGGGNNAAQTIALN